MNFEPTLSIQNCLDLDNEKYNELCKEYVSIGNQSVDELLLNHTTIYSYFHGIACYLKKLVDRQELMFETWEAKYKTELRKNNKLSKLTVEQVKDQTVAQPEYFQLKEDLLTLQAIHTLMRSFCSALDHKKDMLIQISANKRMETKLFA